MNRTVPIGVDLPAIQSAVSDLERLTRLLTCFFPKPDEPGAMPVPAVELSIEDPVAPATRQQLAALAKREYDDRTRREALFGSDLFGEPAWDILLDLYVAEVQNKRVSVTSACIASRAPATTALRWIKLLEDWSLLRRCIDSADGRRTWVELTEKSRCALERLMSERMAHHNHRS